MSPSTALIVNVVLDVVVLGALAYVCRVPLRLRAERASLHTPSRRLQHAREQEPAWTPAQALTGAVRPPPR
jgi:hypothetical protein